MARTKKTAKKPVEATKQRGEKSKNIRELLEQGKTPAEIKAEMGLDNPTMIYQIRNKMPGYGKSDKKSATGTVDLVAFVDAIAKHGGLAKARDAITASAELVRLAGSYEAALKAIQAVDKIKSKSV